ncbi:MAG TPA: hypothetical protein PK112_04730 [candidate division Zixibacteria bacterium]|nr:hypothetical protein [candidate division Zixibacteria bacterium]
MERNAGFSPRLEVIAALALLALVALLRSYQLGADPPLGLSISTGEQTDPPQYTLFARNYVQTGDFDPFDDARRAVFLKSSVTALAVAVFSLLGAGLWQAHLVGLLLGLAALVLFWLFMRKVAGPLAGLLFLFLAAFNYNLIFFGRLPFLEQALVFWAFLAAALLAYGRRPAIAAAAGASLALGIYFGKAIGLVFLFPFACWFAYEILVGRRERGRWLLRLAAFAAGFLVVLAGWYLWVFAPAQAQVAGYYSEQIVDLYGAPEGLQSVDDFFFKLVTFGATTRLFPRMRSAALLSAAFLLIMLFHVTRRTSWREGFGRLAAGHVFVAAMIVAFYGTLMIWNYRPLRYQVVLIYPIYGAAAVVLAGLWRPWGVPSRRSVPLLFYPLAVPIVMVPVYQIWDSLSEHYGGGLEWADARVWVVAASAVIVAAIALGLRFRPFGGRPGTQTAARALVGAVLLGTTVLGISNYHNWSVRPTFTARDVSRDLAMTLGPGAVVSGPYAPLLAAENNLPVVVHMFGVAKADPGLFGRFPITHLLVDEANEAKARADYPAIMDSAAHVVTYHVGTDQVRLYRIAGRTPNPAANAYRPSLLERAIDAYHGGRTGEGHAWAAQFLERHPRNLSAYLAVGEIADLEGQFDLAEESLKGALAFSPTSYNLNARLAELYRERFDETGDPELRHKGLLLYEEAIRLAPSVAKLKSACNQLKTGRTEPEEEVDSPAPAGADSANLEN